MESFDLRRLLVWVSPDVEGVDGAMICDTETWDKAGLRLWNTAMCSGPVAKDLLGPWRLVFEFKLDTTVPVIC